MEATTAPPSGRHSHSSLPGAQRELTRKKVTAQAYPLRGSSGDCLLPNLALFSGLCASLIFSHNPVPICSHFLMNCHLSHSIKSALCEDFSNTGWKASGRGRRRGMRGGRPECLSKETGIEISPAQGPQQHLLHSATPGAPDLLTPEQGSNNHSGLGWPVLPCTALCQAKFDLSRLFSTMIFWS